MLTKLLKLYNPLQLLLAALTYILGAGIARYLGYSLNLVIFGLGLLAALSLHASAFFLAEVFRLPLTPRAQDESLRQREHFRITLLQVSYATLTLSVTAILCLFLTRSLTLSAGILSVLAFLLLMAYAVPPLRLSETGYGELVLAIFMGTILPALGFLLQFGKLHRLLTFTTFPLTLLALAYLLVQDFPTFATDQKLTRHTLLTRLTWQYAVPIHHILILFTFLIFSFAAFLNMPWVVIWPVFLVLPFAAVQVFWLQRIANGGRTVWNFLTAISAATFGLSAYLLALTFWIR
jgi:1,4-dihydroxy-2-naphthoate octaprenyltransferase